MEVLQDTYKDTKIGRIPEGWELISISEIGKISTSSVDKKSKVDETKVSLINYMDVFGSINKKITGAIDFMSVTARESQLIKSQVKKGDVLFTPSSETKKDIGISAVVYEDLPKTLFSYHLLRLSFTKDLNLNFKCYLFNSETVLKQFELLSQGLTRYTIGLGNFNEIFVQLPPITEQQKIAAILSTVDEQISTTDKIIEKSKELKKGLMQKLFSQGIGHTEFKDTKIGRIPKNWQVFRLVELSTLVTNGFVGKATSFYTDEEDGVLYLQGYNVKENKFRFRGVKKVTQEFSRKHSKSILQHNDLLTVQSGHIGTTAKVTLELEGSNCHALIITRPIQERINSDFITYYLNSGVGSKRLNGLKVGSTILHINVKDFRKFIIPVPPLTEQKKIAAILSEADAKIEKEQTQKAQLEALKKGLMQQLLTGEKRVKV